MNLSEIGMLIISSPRSSAYLQALLENELYPAHIIIMKNPSDRLSPGQITLDVLEDLKSKNKTLSYLDLDVSIEEVINSHNISYETCQTHDVNSVQVIDRVKNRPEKYFIYSGPGGVILKDDILNCGKKFIHIHSGSLPDYRGSTTIYYSILNDDKCFATAIFLSKEIDAGDVIRTKTYNKPEKGIDIDYYYDSYIRSDLMIDVIREYLKRGEIISQKQESGYGETYFIIHPVLKHIALLSCKTN